jgi:nucleotide-binding universal stress UspA family protein
MPGILLTTDLSTESKRAFAPARELATKLGLQVTLLAVFEELPFELAAGGMIASYPDRTRIRQDWEKEMAALAKTVGSICTETAVIEAADVPRAIVDYAHRTKADYILMATHGRSGLRRLLLGSVAERVVRQSHVPVLLYPPPAP